MDLTATQQAIEAAKAIRGYLMPPAGKAQIQSANTVLAGHGLPKIPQDFSEYLELCNGFQGANFLLLGTNPMPLAGDYVEPSIFGATQQAIRDEFIDRMSLVLGRSYSGIVVTYHSQKNAYVLLDDQSGQEFEVLPDLLAFVAYMNGIALKTLAGRKYPRHSSG
jgi:hypothetical protein